jgi:hypothetical protein
VSFTIRFEGETLSFHDRDVVGTVLVEVDVTDGSFNHEFGVEVCEDIETSPGGFVPDDDKVVLGDSEEWRAVDKWMGENETRIDRKIADARA